MALEIKLPCTVGDKVYRKMRFAGRDQVIEFTVKSIHLTESGWFVWYSKDRARSTRQARMSEVGRTIFLTPEEAWKGGVCE
jgi:hypothetical protein